MATTIGSDPQHYAWNGEERRNVDRTEHFDISLERAGQLVFRYGLVLIFIWIGLLKFTAYEAKNIEPLVMNSPIWSWAYQSMGLRGLSNLSALSKS